MNVLPPRALAEHRAILKRCATRPLIAAALLLAWWPAGGAEPAGPPVFHATFRAATEAAAADQSLVLLVFGAEWWGHANN